MLIIVIIGQGHWRRHILLLCGFPGFSSVQPPAFDPSSKTKLFYCLSATSQAQKPVFGLSFSFLSQSLVDCAFIFPRPYRPWRHIAVFTTIIDRLIRICCSSCLFVQLRRYWALFSCINICHIVINYSWLVWQTRRYSAVDSAWKLAWEWELKS